MSKTDIDFKFLFPNLIIFLGSKQKEDLFKQLKKSFNEFKYGPIYTEETSGRNELGSQVSTCRIMQGSDKPICLAVGEGNVPWCAKVRAVDNFMKKLCDSCYVIQANADYFTRKKVPPCVLNVDPSNSHIYKVVFLKKNSGAVPFPLPVSGAVDYVDDYKQLLDYIEDHGRSGSKADLFVLNVLKTDRARIRQSCDRSGLSAQYLVGCSDMGIYIYRNMSTNLILQELLKSGGKSIKYKLIGPRNLFGHNDIEGDSVEETISAEGEEVVVNPWIADRLVLMDVINESNELESPREIIWQSVRDCPDTVEFIIEKKKTSLFLASAMIDRNVVGKARGFDEDKVKIDAANDAMQNLKKCCYYIEAKKSYFGTSRMLPKFLQEPNPITTDIYSIANKTADPLSKILKEFKAAWQEDLYFLWNFTYNERNEIIDLAKKMNLKVRRVGGNSCLCVYKRRKPNEILQELMSTPEKENEKYKLIIPPAKYKFIPPTQDQPVHSPYAHSQSAYRWQNQNINRGIGEPREQIDDNQSDSFEKKDLDHKPTLSERLTRLLEEQQMCSQDVANLGTNNLTSNQGDKRPYYQRPDVTTGSDSTKKFKLSTEQQGTLYNEGCRVKTEEEFYNRSETTQQNSSHWNSVNKQEYNQRSNVSGTGQRSISDLFDGVQDVDPQGSRPMFPPGPPSPWRKNRQFRGHSFSKLEKYGKNNGRRGGY